MDWGFQNEREDSSEAGVGATGAAARSAGARAEGRRPPPCLRVVPACARCRTAPQGLRIPPGPGPRACLLPASHGEGRRDEGITSHLTNLRPSPSMLLYSVYELGAVFARKDNSCTTPLCFNSIYAFSPC